MQGLKEGYKWLVKSVITSYLDLGERVAEDIARERKEEEERRAAVRLRLEERRRQEEQGQEASQQEELPGFVPVAQLRAGWAREEQVGEEEGRERTWGTFELFDPPPIRGYLLQYILSHLLDFFV